MSALRIVFFGTPEIAVPTLEALIAEEADVVGVVSQPDRRRGRGKKLSPSPISKIALREEIPLLRPERVGDDETVAALEALSPDLGVVVAFGQFIPKKVRELPKLGYLINAHASLLPKYRGASPIAQAILNGDAETGISVMRIEKEMDAGPVAWVEKTRIGNRENTAELSERLAKIAAAAILKTIETIAAGEVVWTEQEASLATLAPKLEKADAVLDLRESAASLASRIHALAPKPGASLQLVNPSQGDGSDSVGAAAEESLKILSADVQAYAADEDPSPGTIELDRPEASLRVATGKGWLLPRTLQRPGGKAMGVADFLRGYALAPNARFAVAAETEKAPRPETESR